VVTSPCSGGVLDWDGAFSVERIYDVNCQRRYAREACGCIPRMAEFQPQGAYHTSSTVREGTRERVYRGHVIRSHIVLLAC
jgi:hypothetical protein